MPIKQFLILKLRKVTMKNSIINLIDQLVLDKNKDNLVKDDYGKYCGRI